MERWKLSVTEVCSQAAAFEAAEKLEKPAAFSYAFGLDAVSESLTPDELGERLVDSLVHGDERLSAFVDTDVTISTRVYFQDGAGICQVIARVNEHTAFYVRAFRPAVPDTIPH